MEKKNPFDCPEMSHLDSKNSFPSCNNDWYLLISSHDVNCHFSYRFFFFKQNAPLHDFLNNFI